MLNDTPKRPRLSVVNHFDPGTSSISMDNHHENTRVEAHVHTSLWTHFRDTDTTETIKKDNTTCVLACHTDLPQQVLTIDNVSKQDDDDDDDFSTQTSKNIDSKVDQANSMRQSPPMENDNSTNTKNDSDTPTNRIVEELASKLDCWSITNLKEWRKQQIIESSASSNTTISIRAAQQPNTNRSSTFQKTTLTPRKELSPRSVMRQRQHNARKEMIRLMTKVSPPP